jgi:hypothetical protein
VLPGFMLLRGSRRLLPGGIHALLRGLLLSDGNELLSAGELLSSGSDLLRGRLLWRQQRDALLRGVGLLLDGAGVYDHRLLPAVRVDLRGLLE